MKKYIILSVNQNEDYVFFLPLTCFLWRKFGWEPIIFYRGGRPDYVKLAFKNECPYELDSIPGVRDATIAQVSRLYGANLVSDNDMVMLGDIDLIPLGSHWVPENSVKVYNHDLTGRTEIPMCFVCAPKHDWINIMGLSGNTHVDLERDISNHPNAKSDDFYKWWGCDQQILTDRLKKYGYDKIKFIDRGPSDLHGYARGRVDRAPGGWRFDLPELIDAHLEQQTHHSTAKIGRLFDLLRHVWPNENFDWFADYTTEFRKITGHTG